MPDVLLRARAAAGLRLELRVHDYESICPRLTLSDAAGRYCGEPDAAGCQGCLRRNGSPSGSTDIGAWRRQREALLRGADGIVVPDQDVADRLLRYYSGLRIEVVPHEDASLQAAVSVPHRPGPAPARIGVVGAISAHKGFEILRACAEDARRRALPIRFVLMGFSADDESLRAHGVDVTGRYAEAEATSKLASLAPDAVWIPSTWPETYSFTLSLALRTGAPTFAFDLGAVGRRLRAAGHADHLMPLSAMSAPAAVNTFFVERLGVREQAA
jgi:glycosyltransferase involved in cell wall biosynthesis